MNSEWGRWLMISGGIIFLTGLLFYFFHDKISWIGNLPGDIKVEKENFRFYFPITTLILFNLLLFIIIYFIRKSGS